MITIKQLEYFYEAARLEHFNQAAEKLGISEPSLSRAINQLEAEIGLTLFEKRGRGVILTKPGRLFLSHAGTILQQVRNSQARMQELADGAGHIDIAYVAPLAHSYIPQMIRRFQCLPGNENVTFNFYQGLTDSNLQGLKTGKYDLVFGSFSGNEPTVCFVPVLIQEMVVIVPKNHPLAAKDTIDLGKDLFNTVLDTFDCNLAVRDLVFKISCNMERDQFNDAGMILLLQCLESLCDRVGDFADLKINNRSVPFDYFIHKNIPLHVISVVHRLQFDCHSITKEG